MTALATVGFDALKPMSLDEVNQAARLQHRVDRKYLLPRAHLEQFLDASAGDHRVLEVAGRFTTTYDSTYFDTADLAAWRAHVQRRRRRWKIRTRSYTEDGLCRAEIKTKDGRGATVKHAIDVPAHAAGALNCESAQFLDGVLTATGIEARTCSMSPVAAIGYQRATLADLDGGTRLTIDAGLTFQVAGRVARLDPAFVVIETKGGVSPVAADRRLISAGARRASLSKYIVCQALLIPGLPDNDVRRLKRRYFEHASSPEGTETR